MADEASLDERKFQLEREKFEFEKSKSRGNNFLNANIGIVVTAIIGTATVIVSLSQVFISRENNIALLELDKQKAETDKAQEDRRLQSELAKLLLDKAADFTTTDLRRINFLREVVVGVIPSDVGIKIARRMADGAGSAEMRAAWNDAEVILAVAVPAVADASPSLITVDTITAAFPQLASEENRQRVEQLLAAAKAGGVASEQSVAIFLALTFQQTGFLRLREENMNYSAARLRLVFPSRFPTLASAEAVAGNPEKIADAVYGGRLGNTAPGDGWKYRGRGYFMTTGRANYVQLSELLGLDLVAQPELLSDPEVAAKAAVALFARLPDTTSVTAVYRRINGGMSGVSEVQSIYQALSPSSPKLLEDTAGAGQQAASIEP